MKRIAAARHWAGVMKTVSAHSTPPADLLDGCSLFLDFDGTLVEFESDPSSVRLTSERLRLLDRLVERLEGRVAILSGRGLEEITGLIDIYGLTLGGSHGLELRFDDGRIETQTSPPGLEEINGKASEFAERHAVVVEKKPLGTALHFRDNPEQGDRVRSFMKELTGGGKFAIQEGNMVCEIRLPGATKGDVLKRLMGTAPFERGHPLMVGDDLTDEHGFEAAAQLGGAGIVVGDRVPTMASYHLPDPQAFWDWIVSW